MYLEQINGPSDVKKLNLKELEILAKETRQAVINRISKKGGHIGPNLGVVELTVAYHYVFNSPKDKIVFDVSHQCYAHKILTGRKNAFLDENHFKDVTGYTNPNESEHDFFTIGHTSTSIALALGLAKARDVNKENENVVALIGDGSLSGGLALEALDYAGEYKNNLIIILNDNDQSIAENHGGIYKSLYNLRITNGTYQNNPFKAFGLDYRYLDDGHDIKKLIDLFESVKDINHPVVLHIHTTKGKGLKFAEEQKERYHAGGPFDVNTGEPLRKGNPDTFMHDLIKDFLDNDPKSLVFNAATPASLGMFGEERSNYEKIGKFTDVGIAEECAMTMSSGAAKGDAHAVFATAAPFLQRTYDQLSHDLCLNDNPATVLVLSPGVFGMSSNTHINLCDIQFFAHVPNLIYLSPATKGEFKQMFKFATTQRKHPVAIRVSKLLNDETLDTTDYSVLKNEVLCTGENIAVFAYGPLLNIAKEAVQKFKDLNNKNITLINPKFLTGLDEELLNNLVKNHKYVVTLDDGEVEGSYGQTIASYFGTKDINVINLGISKKFHSDFNALELLDEHGISVDKLIKLFESLN